MEHETNLKVDLVFRVHGSSLRGWGLSVRASDLVSGVGSLDELEAPTPICGSPINVKRWVLGFRGWRKGFRGVASMSPVEALSFSSIWIKFWGLGAEC